MEIYVLVVAPIRAPHKHTIGAIARDYERRDAGNI